MTLRERVELAHGGNSNGVKKCLFVYGIAILITNVIILCITFNEACDQPLKYVLIIETLRRILSLIIIPGLLKYYLHITNDINESFNIYNNNRCPINKESKILCAININIKLLHIICIVMFILMHLFWYNCRNCNKVSKYYMLAHLISMYTVIFLYLCTSCAWIGYICYLAYKTQDPRMTYWQTFTNLYRSLDNDNNDNSNNYQENGQWGTPDNVIGNLPSKVYKKPKITKNEVTYYDINNINNSNNIDINIANNNSSSNTVSISTSNNNNSTTNLTNNFHGDSMNDNAIINTSMLLQRSNTHSTDKSSTEILNPMNPINTNVESKMEEKLMLTEGISTANIMPNINGTAQFITLGNIMQPNNNIMQPNNNIMENNNVTMKHTNNIMNNIRDNDINNDTINNTNGINIDSYDNDDSNNLSDSDNNSDDKCAICLLKFENNDLITTLPCKHEYHKECIVNWLKRRKTCPYCRRDITQ